MASSPLRRGDATADNAPAEFDARWSPVQAAEFAAHRDYRRAVLFAKDRRAAAAARRLGLFTAGSSRREQPTTTASTVNGAQRTRGIQTQTMCTGPDGAPSSSRVRRQRERMAAFLKRKDAEAAAATPGETDGGAMAVEDEAVPPILVDTQSQTPPAPTPQPTLSTALEERLAASEAHADKFRKAAKHWKDQSTKAQEQLQELKQQVQQLENQLQQQQQQQQQQSQQQQEQRMEIDAAPSTALAPSPSATREGVSFSQAARADGGTRTPPSKKALTFDEHAREKAAAIDAAGEHLAARAARERGEGSGPRRFDGGKGRGGGKGGGGGRGGAQPSPRP